MNRAVDIYCEIRSRNNRWTTTGRCRYARRRKADVVSASTIVAIRPHFGETPPRGPTARPIPARKTVDPRSALVFGQEGITLGRAYRPARHAPVGRPPHNGGERRTTATSIPQPWNYCGLSLWGVQPVPIFLFRRMLPARPVVFHQSPGSDERSAPAVEVQSMVLIEAVTS